MRGAGHHPQQLCEMGVCWLALGSEGRFEQTLNTDQDNGIIFSPPDGTSADEVRQTLLPLAQRINDALDACGFPLCKGNIMASNPKWCLSLDEWKDTFADWIHRGDAPVLLNATIFFDFRPLFGKQELAHELRAWLNAKIKDNRLFLKHMVQNALGNRPPLGLVRDFVVDGGTLDLKLNGIAPFVDAARIFGACGGKRRNRDHPSPACGRRSMAHGRRGSGGLDRGFPLHPVAAPAPAARTVRSRQRAVEPGQPGQAQQPGPADSERGFPPGEKAAGGAGKILFFLGSVVGKANGDQCPFSVLPLVQADRGAMALRYFRHDGEPKPAAALTAAEHAIEALEDLLAVRQPDARPVVLNP